MRRHDPSRVVHAAACTDRRRSRQELLPRLQEQELTTWADTVSIQPFPSSRFQPPVFRIVFHAKIAL